MTITRMTTGLAALSLTMSAHAQDTRDFEMTVEIEATPQQVWDAFATREGIEHWFALDADVTPGVGGTVRLSWLNEYDWASPIAAWEPNESMRVLWLEPGANDLTEDGQGDFGYDIFIEPVDDDTTSLRLVHFGFPLTPEGDEMFKAISRGWTFELELLQTALGHHQDKDRQWVYSRAFLGDVDPIGPWNRAFGEDALFAGASLASAKAGDAFRATLGGAELRGSVRRCTPGSEMVLDLETQGGAVMQISTENCMVDQGRVLTVLINMWGQDEELARRMHQDTENRLAKLFGNEHLMPPVATSR